MNGIKFTPAIYTEITCLQITNANHSSLIRVCNRFLKRLVEELFAAFKIKSEAGKGSMEECELCVHS
jgi:hypothetical protein